MANFICKDPFCYRVIVTLDNFKISNVEMHGGIPCKIIPESSILNGAKEEANKKFDPLRKVKSCERSCDCVEIQIASGKFHVRHHEHRYKLWGSSWLWGFIPRGNCVVNFDLEFDVNVEVWAGLCVYPEKIKDAMSEIQKILEKLKKLGESFGNLLDPEEIAKRLKAVTPQQLRENENVEPPIKIHSKPK